MDYVLPLTVVALFIAGVFAWDAFKRWRRDNEWKRRLRDRQNK